ncbi:YicC family protein [Flavobacteriaceae bacterium F08102]|nr:YicC family protein [Flavobacteriaceae bacterium F08102]
MIQSMTGYGKSVVQLAQKKITIEIKSLNSKNLDLNVRIPQAFKEKELSIRQELASQLIRGKVEFSVHSESTGESTTTTLNISAIENYIDQLKKVNVTHKDEIEYLKMAMRLPEAIKTEREDVDPLEWPAIYTGIQEAIQEIKAYRMDEGEVLAQDFRERITQIQNLSNQIIELDKERLQAVRTRLHKAVDDLKINIDENRFEQELIYYLEKLDITEEKVRLNNHLDYFLTTLASEDSNGKKLAFIGQEIGREINTTGSKSNYAPMQKIVVQMKDELEKIKEQLLNVL